MKRCSWSHSRRSSSSRFSLHLRFRQLPQPPDQLEVFQAGEVGIDEGLFRHIAEPALEADQVVTNVVPIPEDLPRGGRQQSGEHLHRRGFPGAIGPQITRDLSRWHRKRDVIHHRAIAVLLRQPANVQHRVLPVQELDTALGEMFPGSSRGLRSAYE